MEQIVLDPVEVSSARVQLDITAWVRAEPGIDWGDGAIQAYMADQRRGSTPVDYRVPNRVIQIPLTVKPDGATSFAQARQLLQAKVSRIQQEGGWLKRVTADGMVVFADLVNAGLHLSGSHMQAHRDHDIDATMELEAIPDFYGGEITLGDHVETTATELIWTETGIRGDYPGRVRIVVDEDQGQAQQGLIWGVRSSHYSPATTAALKYEAEALTPIAPALVSGGAIQHSNLSTEWTPVLNTNLVAGQYLTHTGTYRVWIRVVDSVATRPGPLFRFVWDVGDMTLPEENAPVQLTGDAVNLSLLDLGEVRLDRVPVGTHRWQGQVQAKTSVGGASIFVDKIWFVPVDEGYGVLRAQSGVSRGLTGYNAWDSFNVGNGSPLVNKSLNAGGTWQAASAVGTDIQVGNGVAYRSTSAADTGVGRIDTVSGPNLALVQAQVQVYNQTFDPVITLNQGMVLRYVNNTNFVRAYVSWNTYPGWATVFVDVVVGGAVVTTLQAPVSGITANTWYTIYCKIDAAGYFYLWWVPSGSTNFPSPIISGQTAANLAAGGPLASGKVGLYDYTNSAKSQVRYWTNFSAYIPVTDAVVFPNRSAELRTEGMFRQDVTGAAYGPVSNVIGDLPRLPPAGVEGRTTQVLVKMSRGDLATTPDAGVDDLSARAYYRPSWLTVPGA